MRHSLLVVAVAAVLASSALGAPTAFADAAPHATQSAAPRSRSTAPEDAPSESTASHDDDEPPPTFTLRPEPGRSPLLIESAGAQLDVGLAPQSQSLGAPAGTPPVDPGEALCATPCMLYARRGVVRLWSGGPGLRQDLSQLSVPPWGIRVRLRAASHARYDTGFALTLTGGLTLTAGTLVIFGPLWASGARGGPPSALWLAPGLGVVGVGSIAMAVGIALLSTSRTGIASTSPLGRVGNSATRSVPMQWAVGAAPLADGAVATAVIVY